MRIDRRSSHLWKAVLSAVLAILALLCPSLAVVALRPASTRGRHNGPEGGNIQALAISPSTPAHDLRRNIRRRRLQEHEPRRELGAQ